MLFNLSLFKTQNWMCRQRRYSNRNNTVAARMRCFSASSRLIFNNVIKCQLIKLILRKQQQNITLERQYKQHILGWKHRFVNAQSLKWAYCISNRPLSLSRSLFLCFDKGREIEMPNNNEKREALEPHKTLEKRGGDVCVCVWLHGQRYIYSLIDEQTDWVSLEFPK